jgi:hypothetical protein
MEQRPFDSSARRIIVASDRRAAERRMPLFDDLTVIIYARCDAAPVPAYTPRIVIPEARVPASRAANLNCDPD